jgi:hypothetical protein
LRLALLCKVMTPQTELALWIAQPVVQSGVAGAMLWRKSCRNFPRFFNYLLFQIASFLVLFPIFKWSGYTQYFFAYWSYSALDLILGFIVIYEIFLDVMHPYPTLQDLGGVLFQWSSLVMLLVAIVVAASSPASIQSPLVQAIVTVQRCVRVVQVGLVLFLLIFSRYLGVSWRNQSFGIALGFGGYAAVELTMFALHASNHASQNLVNFVDLIAFDLEFAVWLVYCTSKAASVKCAAKPLISERWEEGLSDMQRPEAPESLIYMFEGMVDRALSRNTAETEPRVGLAPVISRKTPSGIHTLQPRKRAASNPGFVVNSAAAAAGDSGN